MIKQRQLKKAGVIGACLLLGSSVVAMGNQPMTAHARRRALTYDISQWQGYITKHQAKKLKREVGFVILRAQDGGRMKDERISHNVHLMNRYHIPYGVYSYSIYRNSAQARAEAKRLYHRAPNAKFYVNDCEENDAHSRIGRATRSWSKTLHHLTQRPTVLYSYLGFMGHFNKHTRHSYDGIWLAAYSSRQPHPAFHYDLWQFSDNYHSRALKRRLDASTRPHHEHAKPLTFWIGKGNYALGRNTKKMTIKPTSKRTQRKIANQGSSQNFNTNLEPEKPELRSHRKHQHHVIILSGKSTRFNEENMQNEHKQLMDSNKAKQVSSSQKFQKKLSKSNQKTNKYIQNYNQEFKN